jgi:hypothetical protein
MFSILLHPTKDRKWKTSTEANQKSKKWTGRSEMTAVSSSRPGSEFLKTVENEKMGWPMGLEPAQTS